MTERLLQNLVTQARDAVRRLERLEAQETPSGGWGWVWLTTPLTSTSWDIDAFSTTAKTKIDLSAVFGAPENIDAVYVSLLFWDSGAVGTLCYIILGDNASAGSGQAFYTLTENDRPLGLGAVIPTDAAGDIYYQIQASGAGAMDVQLVIRGYHLR